MHRSATLASLRVPDITIATMVKDVIAMALLLACSVLPRSHSFSLSMGLKTELRHPNFPDRKLEKLEVGLGGNASYTVTKAGGNQINVLAEKHSFTPVERVFLTGAGNIQTTFSSYYLLPVNLQAHMDMNPPVPDEEGRIPLANLDREVFLTIGGHKVIKVTSKVRMYDSEMFKAYTIQDIGLDQLLRMFKVRPVFTLHDAGRNEDGGMWRFYTLDCHKGMVKFEILEEFEKDAWDLPIKYEGRLKSIIPNPNYPNRMLTKANDDDSEESAGGGLMSTGSGGSLIHYLSNIHNLTPLERVAVTSNGSLQMVFSSYYLSAIDVTTTKWEESENDPEDPEPPLATFDREVSMKIKGQEYCYATTTVRVYDEDMLKLVREDDWGIGQLLRNRNLNPVNTLHDAGRVGKIGPRGGMWRFYSMDCEGVIKFDILEEFASDCWDLTFDESAETSSKVELETAAAAA